MFPCGNWFPLLQTVQERLAMTENIVLESTPLNALDRCDRCGAQAYVRAVMANGFELLFCGHHAKKYQEGLSNTAARIQDETDRITEESAAR